MKTKRNRLPEAALLTLTALLFLIANFRIGYAIVIDDHPYGVYSPVTAHRYIKAATALTREIHGEDVPLEMELSVRVETPEGYDLEIVTLAQTIFESVPGIVIAYAVRADGELLGYVNETSELYELIDAMLYGAASPYAISVGIEQELTVTPTYVKLGTAMDAASVMRRLREIAVISIVEADVSEFVG